jgi:hypothetical protein
MKREKRRRGRRKGKNNRKKEKRKIEKEIEKKKRGKGIIGISPSYPCDTARRSCFVKRFSKTNQLHHRIRFTSTATAEAATATAVPNAPILLRLTLPVPNYY